VQATACCEVIRWLHLEGWITSRSSRQTFRRLAAARRSGVFATPALSDRNNPAFQHARAQTDLAVVVLKTPWRFSSGAKSRLSAASKSGWCCLRFARCLSSRRNIPPESRKGTPSLNLPL
jgi:hypothetical protein